MAHPQRRGELLCDLGLADPGRAREQVVADRLFRFSQHRAGQLVRGQAVRVGADAAPGGASTAAERAAFDRATETLRAGDAAGAADQFARFAADHAGGPLAIEATWQQGVALEAADDSAGAAAAWLQVFSSDPNGTRSPDALLGLGRLAEAGWRAGGLDGSGEQTLEEAFDSQPTVLVMGSEGDGIRRLVAEHCDVLAKIPMPGGFESLNVSNAAAVALYEAARAQRG